MNNQHPQTGYTHAMYALHAFAGFIGITSGATIIGTFVFGLPSIVAIIMNYARRDSVRGSWLESHFTWQIRTFWFALVWACLVFLSGAALAIVLVGFAVWIVGFIALGIWAIYRIARGWMALNARRVVP